jgi:CheY-like chemotaxis protein
LALYCIMKEQRMVMVKNGPILIIEDDADDQELLCEVLKELQIPNVLKFFNSCMQAFDYLLTSIEKPFLIISDINIPVMTGLEMCKKIMDHESLRIKGIPFLFLTTTSDRQTITQAYEIPVQGFFVKPSNIQELKNMLKTIIDYWKVCKHPF